MIEQIFHYIISWVTVLIDQGHYWGVLLLMALESCNIPIPSEIILPYTGFLVSQEQMNFHLAAFTGGLGCLLGSVVSYWLGKKLGRPILWKYGKWLLISRKDIKLADKFIGKYGSSTYFFSRLLPVVRTFISLVAGISNGNFKEFCFYTLIGSWIWSYLLIYFGIKLGDHWDKLGPWWDRFHVAIIALVLGAIVWHVIRVWLHSRETDENENDNKEKM